MLRLSLIIVIIAGIAATVLNVVQVKKVIDDTMAERNDYNSKWTTEVAEHGKTKTDLAKTKEDLDTTKTTLTAKEAALKTANANLDAKSKEVEQTKSQLADVKKDLDKAQTTLIQWDVLKITPTQVKKMVVELDKTSGERDALAKENELLGKKVREQDSKIAELIGVDRPVVLPASARGSVIAVDPKYDFVVVDVGGDKGAKERGELIVNRNGKLVGKLRIASVQSGQSIANVLGDWKKSDLVEGDQVLPSVY